MTEILSSSVDQNRSIESMYLDLSSCLDDLIKIYRSLLEVVRKERDILVSSKLDELNENNRTKDALLVRIRTLENSRMKHARDLAAVTKSDVDHPRLLEIATKLSGSHGDRLRNQHSVLELLVRRVAELNKGNEELVQAALMAITGAMESIKEDLAPKATYERKGAMAQGKQEGGALVSREA